MGANRPSGRRNRLRLCGRRKHDRVLATARELLGWFRESAWLPPYPWVLSQLVEVAPLAVAAAAAFEGAVAVMLLARRHETLALGLAPLGLLPAILWPYWLTNVPLGLGLAVLWWRSRARCRRAPRCIA